MPNAPTGGGRGTPVPKKKTKTTRPTKVPGYTPPGFPGGLPTVDLHIGQIAAELAAARKAGQAAASGQLGTIAKQITKKLGKQDTKYTQQTKKILANMGKLNQQTKEFNTNRKAGIGVTAANYGNQLSASGARGGFMAQGLVGPRRRQFAAQSGLIGKTSSALTQQGKTTQGAGAKAIEAGYGIDKAENKGSMSILDVLAAERQSEDVKFTEQLATQERMANVQFKQDLYKMQYQQQLQSDYQQWQIDHGMVETPGQQRAAEYSMWKKQQDYTYQLAQKQSDPETFATWDNSMSAVTDIVQSTSAMLQSGSADKIAALYLNTPKGVDKRTAKINAITDSIAPQFPQNIDPSIINSVVTDMVDNGGTPPPWSAGDSPDYKGRPLSEIIARTDETGAASTYIQSHPEMARQLQDNYNHISLATATDRAPAPPTPGEIMHGSGGGLGEAVKTIAEVNFGIGAGSLIASNAKALFNTQPGVAALTEGDVGTSIAGTVENAAAQYGWTSPLEVDAASTLSDIANESGIGTGVEAVTAAETVGEGLNSAVGPAGVALGVMKRTDPKGYAMTTGHAYVDGRGVAFKYNLFKQGWEIDIPTAQQHYNELTDEEKSWVDAYGNTVQTPTGPVTGVI